MQFNSKVTKALDRLKERGKIPWKWQLDALNRAVDNIIALIVDCGGGKTLAGILLALQKEKPTIIIAPTHRLCDQWREALLEADEDADIWVYSKPEETKKKDRYREEFEKWLVK